MVWGLAAVWFEPHAKLQSHLTYSNDFTRGKKVAGDVSCAGLVQKVGAKSEGLSEVLNAEAVA
jgi:hypothetical protein